MMARQTPNNHKTVKSWEISEESSGEQLVLGSVAARVGCKGPEVFCMGPLPKLHCVKWKLFVCGSFDVV